MPASANVSENLRTMVENHILERNKHWNKFPRLGTRNSINELEGTPGQSSNPGGMSKPVDTKVAAQSSAGSRRINLFGNSPSLFDSAWKAAAGVSNPAVQTKNAYWWKNRAERSHPLITSGDANVDRNRDKILSASSPAVGGHVRMGSVMTPGFGVELAIHGGTNFREHKKLRYAHIATGEFGPTTVFTNGPLSFTASNNFVFFRKAFIKNSK